MNEKDQTVTQWQIGDWALDGERNLMRRATHEVTLSPRLADLMLYLATHAGHVVSRDELVAHVWHRSIVTDQAVNQSIFELRKALRDGRKRNEAPTYINTVSKRGYVLVAKVSTIESEATKYANATSMSGERTSKEEHSGKHFWSPMVDWLSGFRHHTENKKDKK